jgi:amino acid permease
MYPVSGGFYTYSTRFIDPSWGFAMGWNYVFQWAIVLPLELVVAGLTVGYWNPDINVAVWSKYNYFSNLFFIFQVVSGAATYELLPKDTYGPGIKLGTSIIS